MKTTIDIADNVLQAARELAARRSTTLRELVEGQLRRAIEEEKDSEPLRLENLPVRGGGLQPSFEGADWSAFRDEIYGGRGA